MITDLAEMIESPRTVVIIPALDEAHSIGKVVTAIPGEWVDEIIVVDKRCRQKPCSMG
jgi:hypothetical protein